MSTTYSPKTHYIAGVIMDVPDLGSVHRDYAADKDTALSTPDPIDHLRALGYRVDHARIIRRATDRAES